MRAGRPYESARYRLRGLDPEASYEIRRIGERRGKRVTGRELMEKGLELHIGTWPGQATLLYRTSIAR